MDYVVSELQRSDVAELQWSSRGSKQKPRCLDCPWSLYRGLVLDRQTNGAIEYCLPVKGTKKFSHKRRTTRLEVGEGDVCKCVQACVCVLAILKAIFTVSYGYWYPT